MYICTNGTIYLTNDDDRTHNQPESGGLSDHRQDESPRYVHLISGQETDDPVPVQENPEPVFRLGRVEGIFPEHNDPSSGHRVQRESRQ